MPTFDIVKEICPKKTFRVASVMGTFDLQSENIKENFIGNIDIPTNWQIGLIVGNSGTGKTTIVKELFGKSYITNFKYVAESVLDDMPINCSVEQIAKAFNSVGFSSPPSWIKPYSVLSNGEKMRCDLARAILSEDNLFVFDEFTSVVDRGIAKIGSFAMQKAIRKTEKKFIAVSCHYDVEEWLLPDWVFNTNSMTFRLCDGQKKNRPKLNFKIYETTEKKYYWKMFARYHYLNHSHNNCARVFIATINDDISAFISVFTFPCPQTKLIKKVHRLVVLPDFQGIGIGKLLLNEIGKIFKNDGFRYTITTSQPSLIFSLKNDKNWRCTSHGRKKNHTNLSKTTCYGKNGTGSQNRITTSWEMN